MKTVLIGRIVLPFLLPLFPLVLLLFHSYHLSSSFSSLFSFSSNSCFSYFLIMFFLFLTYYVSGRRSTSSLHFSLFSSILFSTSFLWKKPFNFFLPCEAFTDKQGVWCHYRICVLLFQYLKFVSCVLITSCLKDKIH